MTSPYRESAGVIPEATPEQIEAYLDQYIKAIDGQPSMDERQFINFAMTVANNKRLQRIEDFLKKHFEESVEFHKEAAREGIRE
jgi:hypothetical protein